MNTELRMGTTSVTNRIHQSVVCWPSNRDGGSAGDSQEIPLIDSPEASNLPSVGEHRLEHHTYTLVDCAQQLTKREITMTETVIVLDRATVYLEKPATRHAALHVYTVQDDHWVLAFSSLQRLAAARGMCEWISLTGQDLMDNMPPQVNLGIDVQDDHSFFVPAALIAARAPSRGPCTGQYCHCPRTTTPLRRSPRRRGCLSPRPDS